MEKESLVRVAAPSRLHFGLLSLPMANSAAGLSRHFGSVGLMVCEPGVQVSVRRAAAWSAAGPQASRALAFAQGLVKSLAHEMDCPQATFEIFIDHCPPEHIGLGIGTQLGLAVARAVAVALGRADLDAVALAQRIGRGARSGLGVHGFARGGFLVDGGKGATTTLAPLIARQSFPEDWQVVLVMPRGLQGLHGLAERQAFTLLAHQASASAQTDALCRLLVLGLLPSLAEHDLPAFGEALYEFNHRVGEQFAPWQGGAYAHSRTTALVEFLRQQGIAGVGQSSWGPTVFAVMEQDRSAQVAQQIARRFELEPSEIVITSANNRGATLTKGTIE